MQYKVRGISNGTTACHISSTLLILFHCLPPIREVLLRLPSSPSSEPCDHTLLDKLCEFARDYRDLCCHEQKQQQSLRKPNKLYLFMSRIGIQAEAVGDAVTTLAKLMHYLRFDCPNGAMKRVASATLGGTAHSDLRQGRRLKQLPPREMNCPYVVRGNHCRESLVDALRETLQPTVLQSYQWPEGSAADLSPDKDQAQSPTTKTLVVDQLPPVWLIQIDCWDNSGMEPLPTNAIHVPLSMSSSLFHSTVGEYELNGGIVYVESGDEEDVGHTVAVLRGSDEEDNWYLVDDESVCAISSDVARSMLGGSRHDIGVCRGMLVVYQRRDWSWSELLDEIALSSQQSTDAVDWGRPSELVGRRVRIKWAGGVFYPGTVSAYDCESGKHTVFYDDGDERTYKLHKKTLEWL